MQSLFRNTSIFLGYYIFMKNINLVVAKEIVDSFKNIIAMSEDELILSATKGTTDDAKESVWTFGVLPKYIVDDLSKEFLHDCMVLVGEEKVFVYPFNLVWQLEGKKFVWVDEFIELCDMK